MNRTIKVLVCIAMLSLFVAACSNGGTNNPAATSMPQPQVRVGSLPSATAAEIEATGTPEPILTPTQAAVFYDPTPDVDQLANQIDNMINDISRRLKSQNYILK